MTWLITFVMTLAGLYLFVLGTYSLLSNRRNLAGASTVKLRVVALHEERNADDDTVIVPEFEFLDGPKVGTRQKSAMGEPRALHQVGDEVDGLYNAETGHLATVAEQPFYTWMPIWAMVGGLFLLIVPSYF